MPLPRRKKTRDVFINCPFDAEYKELFNALVFTIYDCGFYPRCALESSNAGDLRFAKICRLIRECRYGIHDLSRVELSASSNLPRFNMPLELGLFLGAVEFRDIHSMTKTKLCLVMDSERYRYHKFCSDLAGVDISAHENDVRKLIHVVRDWLAQTAPELELIPGGEHLYRRYQTFLSSFPELCAVALQDPKFITFGGLKSILEGWLEGNDWNGQPASSVRIRKLKLPKA
jgi:hypothetical protein